MDCRWRCMDIFGVDGGLNMADGIEGGLEGIKGIDGGCRKHELKDILGKLKTRSGDNKGN